MSTTPASLIAEAEEALRKADPLCADANAYYSEIKQIVEQTTVLWARILFLHTAQQDQLQSIGNVCLVIHNGSDKARAQCSQKIKQMKKCRHELHELLGSLRETSVDEAFKGRETLYDFVHEDSISLLETQVEQLTELMGKRVAEIEAMPNAVQQQLSKLRAQAPDLPTILDNTVLQILTKTSSKSGQQVHDMAQLLTSLTSNYDLCRQIPDLDENEAKEATNVVLGDREQVVAAVERLKELRTKLRGNNGETQRLQHSLAMTFEQFRAYDDTLTEFITGALRHALQDAAAKNLDTTALLSKVDEIITELAGLTEYYRLFRKSYDAAIVEVNRRHESTKQLKKVIENANAALRGFQVRELAVRQEFLKTYQEYIPPELWPGMADMPKEYMVDFQEEDLPELTRI